MHKVLIHSWIKRKRHRRVEIQHFGAGVFIVLLVFGMAFSFAYFGNPGQAHASAIADPTTPAAPVCGLRSTSDVTRYTGPTTTYNDSQGNATQAFAQLAIASPSGHSPVDTHAITINGSNYMYIENAASTSGYTPMQITIYNLTNPSVTPVSFPIGDAGNAANSSFSVDPQGGVYVTTLFSSTTTLGTIPAYALTKYNTTDANGNVVTSSSGVSIAWQKTGLSNDAGPAFSYVTNTGTTLVGEVNSVSGNNPATETATTFMWNSSGVAQPNSNIDIQATSYQDATTGDFMDVDSNGVMRVYANTGTLKFTMSDSSSSSSVDFVRAAGVVEIPGGGYFVSVPGTGIEQFQANGVYVGLAVDDQADNYAPNVSGYHPSNITEVGGTIYYHIQGLNLDAGVNTDGMYSITPAQLEILTNYPEGADTFLGAGANFTTGQDGNYFAPGTTPTVNLTFSPWWQSLGSSLTGQYTVTSASQVEANTTGPTQAFSIPSDASAYSSGVATVPLSVPSTPGVYEVSMQLLQGGTVVSAQCSIYSVGATGDTLSLSSLPQGTDTSGIALAKAFGQKLYRSSYTLDQCFDTSQAPTASMALQATCLPGGATYEDITAAAALAAQDGVVYEIQLGTGTGYDQSVVATSGAMQHIASLMMQEFPTVTDWEAWNEPDNNTFSSANDYVTRGLEPVWDAKQAVAPNDKVIGISIEGNNGTGPFQSYVNAGALNYLNIVAGHFYTGWGQSFEEQAFVVPSIYNSAGQTGGLQAIQSYFTSVGYTGPIYDTESGFGNSMGDPDSYNLYSQGDKQVRKMIMEQSIGMNWLSNFYNQGGWNIQGLGSFSLIGDVFDGALTPGGLASVNYANYLGGRTFKAWLPTNIPHTYAADYGPSSTSTSDMVVVWSEDYNVNAVASLSGGGTMNINDEYGAPSTLNSGSTLPLTGQVQYITVPAGQTLTIAPQETYGANYALTASGASAVGSSNWVCPGTTANPDSVLRGTPNTQSLDGTGGSNWMCAGSTQAAWSPTDSDTNPTLTVHLASTTGTAKTNVDRIFVGSFGLGSSRTNLRSYTVSVDPSCSGGSFTTAAVVSGLFYNNNNLVNITPQTVCQIQFSNFSVNITGIYNGMPPLWWSDAVEDLVAPIDDVEVFSSGTQAKTSAPTVSVTSPTVGSYIHTYATLTANATDNSGSGLAQVQFYANGSLICTATSSPYTCSWGTYSYSNGGVSITAKATDNDGDTTTSAPVTAVINNADGDNSGSVDSGDLSRLALNYGLSGKTFAQGNYYLDSGATTGTISSQAVSVFAKNYGWINQ